MKKDVLRKIWILVFQIFSISIHAQLSESGVPLSFNVLNGDLHDVPIIIMPKINYQTLYREDSIANTGLYKSSRFATPFKVNINLKIQGLKEEINQSVIYSIVLFDLDLKREIQKLKS